MVGVSAIAERGVVAAAAGVSLEARVDAATWASVRPDAGLVDDARYHLWWLAAALTWRPMVSRWVSLLMWLLVAASVAGGWAAVRLL